MAEWSFSCLRDRTTICSGMSIVTAPRVRPPPGFWDTPIFAKRIEARATPANLRRAHGTPEAKGTGPSAGTDARR